MKRDPVESFRREGTRGEGEYGEGGDMRKGRSKIILDSHSRDTAKTASSRDIYTCSLPVLCYPYHH